MAKTFREWSFAQRWLLPPSVEDLLPSNQASHFVRELVREEEGRDRRGDELPAWVVNKPKRLAKIREARAALEAEAAEKAEREKPRGGGSGRARGDA